MKPSESRFIQKLMEDGKPFILAQYVTGKVEVSARVEQAMGKREEFASVKHGLILNGEVRSIPERLDEDREKIALKLPRDAEGKIPADQQAKFLGLKMGDHVVILLKSFVWDEVNQGGRKKMQLRIGGNVVLLA